jgi:hypothetical protein
MKRFSFFTRLILCCTLTIFLTTVMFSIPSNAQSPKEELYRASALYKDGVQRFNVADFSGAIGQWEDALAIFKKYEMKQLIGAVTGALGSATAIWAITAKPSDTSNRP